MPARLEGPFRIRRTAAALLGAWLLAWAAPVPADPAPAPVKLAVFDFELEDISASAASAGESPADAKILQAVSEQARQVLAQSGRYSLVDTGPAEAAAAKAHALHGCDGCEAGIARSLGAAQALLGVITRVEKSSYAVRIQISDAQTGKILDQQSAVFLGGDDGWASGAASLIRHRVLSGDYPP